MRALFLLLVAAAVPAADYAVLVSRATRAEPAWAAVVDALTQAHHARVIELPAADPRAAAESLRADPPRLVCWVARPSELGPPAVQSLHVLARGLDADPYPDFRWGIVTGRTAADAARLVAPPPLVIRKVGASTAFAAECAEEAWWFDEFNAGERRAKVAGGTLVRSEGAKDSTADIARFLSEGRAELWITSGHASERDWQPGYRYRNGIFVPRDGVVLGKALDGTEHPVRNDRPMLYLAVGNCLIGNVPGPDCMALSYLSTAGVRGMVGYVVPTWFGYAGWGVLDYFLEQPGRFGANEAWCANLIALEWRLGEARAGRAPVADVRGLEFDQDVTVYLGDPAWEARMAPGPVRWRETVAEDGPRQLTWSIEPLAGDRTFEPVNTNGSQRGGRPLVLLLPRHAAGWEVVADGGAGAVAGDDFVLIPNPGSAKPAPARIEVRLRRR